MEDLFIFVVKKASKSFDPKENGFFALRDISLTFPSRGLVGLLGKSGSGKSTLLNLLSGNEKPSSGRVLFNGKNIAKLKKNELEKIRNHSFGFVYQHFNLIEYLSVLENISLPLLIRGETKKEAYKAATKLLESLNMSFLKDKKVSLLSGGEKQRICLLRAIIGNPDVIFADEPTGALDKDNGVLVMELLKEQAKDKLVIVVSHNEELIKRYSDYAIRLRDGYVVESNLNFEGECRVRKSYEKTKRSKWIWPILFGHFKRNKGKNSFTLISSLIGFLTIMLSFGFFNGSQIVAKNETKRLLTKFNAGISKKETIDLKDSPISLTKLSRPSIEEINNIVSENVEVGYDLSYFIPSKSTIRNENGSVYESSLMPLLLKSCDTYYDLLNDKFFDATIRNGCVVNNQFIAETNCFIGETITLKHEIAMLINDKKETISIKYEFVIASVASEFSFLNEPRLYYDYETIIESLLEYETEEGSNLFELIENASPSESLSCYQLMLFPLNEIGVEEVENLSDSNGFSLTSNYQIVKDSFESLHKAVNLSLTPFVVLEAIMVVFISGFVSYSTFLDQKKEAAVLSALGATKSSLIKIYVLEGIILTSCGMAFALALSFPFEFGLNWYLASRLELSNLIRIPFGLLFVLASLIFSIFLGFVGTRVPLGGLSRCPLSEALKEE